MIDAQELYAIVLDKMPKREYAHIEDPGEDSEILDTLQDEAENDPKADDAIRAEEIQVAI